MYSLQTQRLGLRPWQECDFLSLCQMNQNEQVMRYFPKTLSETESQQMFERLQAHFDEYGYGLFAVDLLETKQFIGFIGLTHPRFETDFTPCVEIGWRMLPQFWNKGYATEGALACLEYGFKTLHLPEIYSFTTLTNEPSQRVMQKIGMTFWKTFEHPNLAEGHHLRPHVIYKIGLSTK